MTIDSSCLHPHFVPNLRLWEIEHLQSKLVHLLPKCMNVSSTRLSPNARQRNVVFIRHEIQRLNLPDSDVWRVNMFINSMIKLAESEQKQLYDN